jgi:hypothetical protein
MIRLAPLAEITNINCASQTIAHFLPRIYKAHSDARRILSTMISNILPPFLPFFFVGLLVHLCLKALIQLTQHQNEPQVTLDSIPFLQPIVELVRWRYKVWLHIK